LGFLWSIPFELIPFLSSLFSSRVIAAIDEPFWCAILLYVVGFTPYIFISLFFALVVVCSYLHFHSFSRCFS
jgi:hypothetical protein